MSVTTADHSAAAMQASAEGQMGLVAGDVVLAKAKYAEAGDILRRDGERLRKASEKHLQQFLAATQYYLGGHYHRAYGMAKKIESRFLTPHVAGLLAQFLKDTITRSAPDYERRVRRSLEYAWDERDPAKLLSVLQEHPYVLDSARLSFFRAVSCEQLGNYRAAALFFKAACRYFPSEIELLLNTIIAPLRLPSQGHLEEAWEYAQYLVELLPHPVTFITASVVCYRRSASVAGEQRGTLLEQQLDFLAEAWDGYGRLSEGEQAHVDVKPYLSLGLVAGAHAWLELGDATAAVGLCNRAIALAPSSAAPWTLRGTITHPSRQAVADFQKATTLPDAGHVPFAMLAANAWGQRDASATLAYCQQALSHNPEPESAAKLYGWMAACRSILGASINEVDTLYKKALEVFPGHEEVTRNYEVFLNRAQSDARRPDRPEYDETVIELSPREFRRRTEPHFSPSNPQDIAVRQSLQMA